MEGDSIYTKHLVRKIVFIYAFFSSIWIFASDQLLRLFNQDCNSIAQLQTLKGWSFILISSGFLYCLVSRVIQSVQKSHSILKAVIEGTTDAIFVKDIEGRYVMINATMAHILGKPVSEIMDRDDTAFFTLENACKIREIERRIMATGQTQIIEETIAVDNSRRTYLIAKDVYRDSKGKIIGLIGIAQDITDRKQLEIEREQLLEQLRQETADLKALSLVTANSISTLDLEELLNLLLRRIVQVMQADAAIILLTEGDHLSVRSSIGIEFAERESFAVPIGQGFAGTIAATQQPLYIEDAQTHPLIFSHVLKQRGIRSMLGVPLKRNGTLVGVLHVDWYRIHPYSDREVHLLQITAERCAMAILNAQLFEETKQLQERLQLQIDRMPIGCILFDPEFRVTDWNPAAENIFGFKKAEVLGRFPEGIVPIFARSQVEQILQRLKQGDMMAHSVNQNLTKDGRLIICEWNNTPLKQADGTLIGHLSMVQDITIRQQVEEALRQSEERFRQMAENIHEVFWMANFELNQILYVSPAYEEIWGRSCKSLYEQANSLIDAIHPEDRQQAIAVRENNRQTGFTHEYRILRPDGTVRCIWEQAFPVRDQNGEIYRLVGVAKDITERQAALRERKQAEEALQESERRYYNLAKVSPVGIFRSNAEGQCLYLNEKGSEMTGLSVEEALAEGWVKSLHPEDRERVLAEWQEAMREQLPFELEYRFLRPDGAIVWVLGQAIAEIGETGEVTGYVGTLTDITERKEAEEQLRLYAFYDMLTGLPNRTLFLQHLRELIVAQQRNRGTAIAIDRPSSHQPFAILFLDLERFKVVQYSLGHLVADQLLIATAKRLKKFLRPTDIAARIGLDEFAILLTHLQDANDATVLAEQIHQELQLPFMVDEREVFITSNIGIALSSINYDRAEDFLRAADTAMHVCKQQGTAHYAIFDPGWQAVAVTRLQMETDLRRAIERQELRVYYQPIISITNNGSNNGFCNKITGFEALVRWQHPKRGFISPAEFIPLAEETGLIIHIDRWVLQEACHQLKLWQQAFPSQDPLTMSVNLSGFQLAQLGLIERIDQILHETGINGSSLKLEITESVIMENATVSAAMLEQLKALGLQLSIDDFGTGYSSLARLHHLPIDTLKIDRSFVAQMNIDRESLEIVRTILTLAHTLKMDAIAEGIETAEQLAQLQTLGCEYGQGYFFYKPIDSETAWALLRSQLH